MTAIAITHPQPSIFETVKVKVEASPVNAGEDKPRRKIFVNYDHTSYEAQRDMVFGDLAAMHDAVTERLLDAGWVPGLHGGLIDPQEGEKIRIKFSALQTPREQFDHAVTGLPSDPAAAAPSALEAAIAEGDDVPEHIKAQNA